MIVLCAGGTGGHVFPAEGLAAILKKRGHKLALITDNRAMNFVNYEYFDAIQVLNVKRNNPLVYIYTLLKSTLMAMYFLTKHRAKIAIGFGGYPSLPGMLASKLLWKKCLVHEQNAVLGRANRLLLPLAKGLAVSFAQTKYAPDSAVWLGNPLRELVQKAMTSALNKNPKYFHLCVVGGSQGAKLFSQVVPEAITLLPKELRDKLSITQQCRSEQLGEVKQTYKTLGIKAVLESFFSDLPDRLRNTDLAICRAGASTIAELTCFGVPAIFIPLAIAKDNDQRENAQTLVNVGGAWMLTEKELTPLALLQLITTAMQNPVTLDDMGQAMRNLAKPNAAEDLANWVEGFLYK